MREHELISASRALSEALSGIRFRGVRVYNPLGYAWPLHEAYLRMFAQGKKGVFVLGMNPGPWGMSQTGVPFGAVPFVRDELGLQGAVGTPPDEHPKRPVQGLRCEKVEVSGTRLWPWLASKHGGVASLARGAFVHSYCPLAFLAATGRNVTPDKLPAAERHALFPPCDEALRRVTRVLEPRVVLAVGRFAEAAAQRALADVEGAPPIFCVQHPSPANPAANRGWAEAVERQLADAGVDVASWARQSGGDSGRKRARPDGDGDDSGEEGIAQPRKVGAGE